jgi:lipopolysaccharide biosynthesis glycosyltransferase
MIALTLVTDQKGLRLARYAITSFLLAQRGPCDIHLYCDGFELAPDDPLFAIANQHGRSLQAHSLSGSAFSHFNTAAHISTTQFLKFRAIEPLLAGYDRVLYADTDLLFFEDLPLAEFDMQGHPLAAVYDVAEVNGITSPDFAQRCHDNGLSPEYFNSGLMLFASAQVDLETLRAQYEQLVTEHQKACPYKPGCRTNDQCVWNLLFENNWQPAPLGWNTQASMRFTRPWASAPVRHYTGPAKALPLEPWRSDSREIALVNKIAQMLGDPCRRVRNPGDLIYRANGLRWRQASKRMEAAYAATEARLIAAKGA